MRGLWVGAGWAPLGGESIVAGDEIIFQGFTSSSKDADTIFDIHPEEAGGVVLSMQWTEVPLDIAGISANPREDDAACLLVSYSYLREGHLCSVLLHCVKNGCSIVGCRWALPQALLCPLPPTFPNCPTFLALLSRPTSVPLSV